MVLKAKHVKKICDPKKKTLISSLCTLITNGTEPQDYVNINENVPSRRCEARMQTLDEMIKEGINAAEGRGGNEEKEDENTG